MTTKAHDFTSCLAGLGLLLGAGACNELERIDDGGSSAAGIPEEVQRAFNDGCVLAGCHDAARAGGLELTAGAAAGIIGGESQQSSLPLVELGNVQGSYLAIKLLPMSELRQADRMPLGRDFNDPKVATDNAIILGWIAGAELPGGDEGMGTDAGMMTGTDGSGSGDVEIVMCGYDVVAPDAPDPYDSGTEAGQIPVDVGTALFNNCGCHASTEIMLIEGAPQYSGQIAFTTIDEVQADFLETGRAVHEILLERVESTEFSRMPPSYYCMLEGGETITADDRQLLLDWLGAGAPDAPNWNPPG